MNDPEVFTNSTDHMETNSKKDSENEPRLLQLPLDDGQLAELRAGERVLLSGSLFLMGRETGKHLMKALENEEELSIEFKNATIYHSTPGNTPLGKVIGSLAPDYTSDFEAVSPSLIREGVRCLIGRGPLSENVLDLLKHNRGLYLVTVGGAGSLLSHCVYQSQILAFEELEIEALRSIKVERFPCIVAVDGFGRSLFSAISSPFETEARKDEDKDE